MKKISVIVPNYNNERFIYSCLESVISQQYSNLEIIIIDDGSTDGSVDEIKRFISDYAKYNIRLMCQPNLNASIARNRGLEVATGDYVLFLDSDDLLKPDILKCMVDTYEDTGADLIMGGFEYIDVKGRHLKYRHFENKPVIYDIKTSFATLIDMSPVPSNKLYNLKLIKENNLWWGNVKIGQDLDFYLKYLTLCKKVIQINSIIYKYRIVKKSMTRTYDYRIFDIVSVFDDIKKYYIQNSKKTLYEEYFPVLMLKHYMIQMAKQRFYALRRERLLIVNYFAINARKLNYSNCKNCDDNFRKNLKKFKFLIWLRFVYTSRWFKWYHERRERKG